MKSKNTDSITIEDGTTLNGTERCVLTLIYRYDDDAPITVKDLDLLIDVTQKTIRTALHSLDDDGLIEVGRLDGENDGTPLPDPLGAWITDHGRNNVDTAAPGSAKSIETRIKHLERRVERLEAKLVEQPSQDDINDIKLRVEQQQKTTNSIRRILHEADLVDSE